MSSIAEDIQLQRLRFWAYRISATPFRGDFIGMRSKPPPMGCGRREKVVQVVSRLKNYLMTVQYRNISIYVVFVFILQLYYEHKVTYFTYSINHA